MASFNFSSLFGSSLTTKSGNVDTDTHLRGKIVLIYFSAHWCGPCRGFTPELSSFYGMMESKGTAFEIVFVSSDRDEKGFNEYYGEMPWAALPFSERSRKQKLSSQFKVQGIPTLVVLDSNGALITADGREAVSNDPEGIEFPWPVKSFHEVLGSSFLSKTGEVAASSFSGKYVALYFSAHWCPPCRAFTPRLSAFYNRRKEQGHHDFEVIFCSADKDAGSFGSYFGEMPWLALPFKDSRFEKLQSRFEVGGYPTVILVDPDGKVITKDARGSFEADPEGLKFPYHPEAVQNLELGVESFGGDINSTPSLVAFIENLDDGAQADAVEALTGFAETLAKAKANTPDGPEMLFFVSTKPTGISGQIRKLTKLDQPAAVRAPVRLVLLNLADSGAYYFPAAQPDDDLTAAAVGAFIEQYKAGALTRQQIQR